jgi:hypothetical protein
MLNIVHVKVVALCEIWDFHRDEGARYLKKLGLPVNTYENYEDLLAGEKNLQASWSLHQISGTRPLAMHA